MNNTNSPALFRSLIVYAVCVPLSIAVGYALTNIANYRDYQSLGMIGLLAAILIFPLLMKWHYPLLIFSWSAPITVFFFARASQSFHADGGGEFEHFRGGTHFK